MEKTITFEIPKGYVIDKENSTDNNIVLKLSKSIKSKTWEDYCKKMEGKNSYYLEVSDYICKSSQFGPVPVVSEFENYKDAEVFAAFSKLLKLRKDWIGDWKPDWTNGSKIKYVIFTENNEICVGTHLHISNSMSFPTEEMRDEFFDCFKNLLEEAKTLL